LWVFLRFIGNVTGALSSNPILHHPSAPRDTQACCRILSMQLRLHSKFHILLKFIISLVVSLGSHVTVSAKIPKELREEMRALNIKPSEVIRHAIEEEVRKKKLERLLKDLESIRYLLTKPEKTVKLIREIRDER